MTISRVIQNEEGFCIMVDYRTWVNRAIAFTQSLSSLRGEVSVTAELHSPISHSKVGALNKKLRLPLPPPLVDFLTTASGNCVCSYWWKPPEELQSDLEELFPYKSFILGGATLCNAEQFEDNEIGCYDTGEAMQRDYPADGKLWLSSVPFYEQGNGDYLALYVGADRPGNDYPVVYLDHDGCGYSRLLSASFDEFLGSWEELSYIHAFFISEFFRDPVTGYVNPKLRRKEELKALFQKGRGKGKKRGRSSF
jgi:hypothetical protein